MTVGAVESGRILGSKSRRRCGHLNSTCRSRYLQGTCIKQVIKFQIEEGRLPESCRIALKLRKPSETTRYCYTFEQFKAMLDHSLGRPSLQWLGNVILGLGMTGLRIRELASLRWSDVDFAKNMIHLSNDPLRKAGSSGPRRRTKNRRDRSLPIHSKLGAALGILERRSHGRVFGGPQGGALDPDRVRTVLVQKVIGPLKERFPTPAGQVGFEHGRLHSFRHFFCSWAASCGVPERTVMTWLGHREARMASRYFSPTRL